MHLYSKFFRLLDRQYSPWLLAVLFGVAIIAKNIIFHEYCFNQALLTAEIWNNSLVIGSVLLPKISVAVLLSGVLLLTPRKYWTIIFLFLYDTWCVANLVYFRSTMSLIDVSAVSMVGNMKGFWDSVWFLLAWKDCTFYAITFFYTLLFFLFNSRQTRWKASIILFLLSYGMTLMGIFCMTKRWGRDLEMFYEPLSKNMRRTLSGVDYTLNVRESSLVHAFGFILLDFIEGEQSKHELSSQDREDIAPLVGKELSVSFDNKLVIILVESLENWSVNPVSMPHLYHFIETHPCLWAHKIAKQTLNGASSDGQLIINTGLLPISQGAVCYLFPSNKFPSIASCAEGKAATIIPHEITVWNQHYLSLSWGYDTTIVRTPNDTILAEETLHLLQNGYQMVQMVTMASHIPFDYGASRSHLQLPESMPRFMADYMKSLHYTDEGLALLLNQIDADSTLQNTTIVITGDHTIFYPDQRREFASYCETEGLDFAIQEAYCPLIIYSPKRIVQRMDISVPAYQMDIYPTVMSLLGCEDYYWQGVGTNLLDEADDTNRRLTESEAYRISDIIIRSDYFDSK